jgi:hypothetical protein
MNSQPPEVGTAAYDVKITRSSVTAKTILGRSCPCQEVSTINWCALCAPAWTRLDRTKGEAEAARCPAVWVFVVVRSIGRDSRFTGMDALSKVS